MISAFRRNLWLFSLILAALVSMLAVAACGGDDEGDGGGNVTTATTPAEEENGGDGGGGEASEFDVTMTDNAFDPNEVTVEAGADVTFNLANNGTAIHNMRIAGEDGEYNTDDDAVSEDELINGGDSGVVNWTAPDAAGEIDFQCDFHPSDMTGTITVE